MITGLLQKFHSRKSIKSVGLFAVMYDKFRENCSVA